MKDIPPYPLIYELNAWTWLNDLSRKYNRKISLLNVPDSEWDRLKMASVDVIWLMGVWERSPAGIRIVEEREDIMSDFREVLPDLQADDIAGSPYCIRSYEVASRLGGKAGLAKARHELAQRELHLFLDFVPNHTAPDHEWATQHPEYYIQGNSIEIEKDPSSYLEINGNIIARARDPYYPAWPDVIQLNAYNPDLRIAISETLKDIASQCDGIRCDMAMLTMNDIFRKTWGEKAGIAPKQEFWAPLIREVKITYPKFKFIGEVYWNMEWELQQEGFDYCYDKRLYDRLMNDSAESIRSHLYADISYQDKLLRFLENHDEPRVASILPEEKEKAAMLAIMTLPGAKLLHEGQAEGMQKKLPVFLGRRPQEEVNENLESFYLKLMKTLNRDAFHKGHWTFLTVQGWNSDPHFINILAWGLENETARFLIVINYSAETSCARIILPWYDLMGKEFILDDLLSGNYYERSGDKLKFHGLYVELGPWQYHFLHFKQ